MKRLSSYVLRSMVSLSVALAGGCGFSSSGNADSVRNLSADRGGGAVHSLQKKSSRILFNNDGTFILGNGVHGGRPLTRADVRAYVDLVTNTPVTTYIICMNSSMPYYSSRLERHIGAAENSKHTAQGGLPHKGENCLTYGDNVRRLADEGNDIVSLVIGRSREVGLEVFTSMRVNDLHFTDRAACNPPSQAEFWLDHPECDLGKAAVPGWHAAGAMNFEHREVRSYKLALLREAMERFAPDGHEMDLMRFPVYFPAERAEADCPLMTEFIRQSREIAKQAGRRAGRERLFGVRVPASVELCRRAGIDVAAWAREGLLDFVTVSAFFVDVPTLPVSRFRQDMGVPDVPIYAGLDHGVADPKGGWGLFRAAVANRWREGADGLYFFNFFYTANTGEPAVNGLTRCGASRSLLCELSQASALCGRNKIYNAGGAENAYGTVAPSDLPAQAAKGEARFRLPMSEGAKTPREVLLFLRLEGADEAWRAIFNGEPCLESTADAALYGLDKKLATSQRMIAFSVDPSKIKDGDNDVMVKGPEGKRFTVRRADCVVIHGDVKTCGYF